MSGSLLLITPNIFQWVVNFVKHPDIITSIPMIQRFASKGKFKQQEDYLLIAAVGSCVTVDWSLVATAVPGRTARQCRERWNNYVKPSLNTEEWTDIEDALLLEKFREFGPKLQLIAQYFEGRARNKVRNRIFALQRRESRDADLRRERAREREEAPLVHQDVKVAVNESVPKDPLALLDVVCQDWEMSWHTTPDTRHGGDVVGLFLGLQ
jgi:hypothetical protein